MFTNLLLSRFDQGPNQQVEGTYDLSSLESNTGNGGTQSTSRSPPSAREVGESALEIASIRGAAESLLYCCLPVKCYILMSRLHLIESDTHRRFRALRYRLVATFCTKRTLAGSQEPSAPKMIAISTDSYPNSR
ncbi:hypothetical protein TNIN_33991 [Trichonephila inaurata madagascariensis]|uniref:Uncharacterized protein n=1 Tax=Trichonephila inaurata madagascariensis TaxID=2747483 RepID=A0A8X6MAP1_9ARAC|nr:hypothetical protein TNIN_33991 [Trichonephila inaurata madagascariensis]